MSYTNVHLPGDEPEGKHRRFKNLAEDPSWVYDCLSMIVMLSFLLTIATVLVGSMVWCVLAFFRNTF